MSKKVAEQVAFLRTLPFALRLATASARQAGQRVRLWLMDESRFGLLTRLARRITLPGIAPVGRYQQERATFWLYGVSDALSGESYFRAFSRLSADHFQAFVDDLVTLYPQECHLLLVDNSRTHHARRLVLPATVQLLFLPPYSPELNPIERLWHFLKAQLAGTLPDSLLLLQEQLAALLEPLASDTVRSLVAPQWLRAAAANAGLPV